MTEVAIVGFASSTRELANELPESVEIWGLNNLYRPGFLKRADRWFELHSRAIWDTNLDARRGADYPQWLAAFGGPVYLLEQQPDIPNSVRYPIEAVVADVGDYLTSTAAYMAALAILERVAKLYVFGFDMAERTEYATQRAGFEYVLGVARGRGIEVILPASCPIGNAPLYGRGAANPDGERITDNQFARRLAELDAKTAEIQREIDARQAQLLLLEGARKETVYWLNMTPEGVPQDVWRALSAADATGAATVNGVVKVAV